MKKILFIVSDDFYFLSHRLSLALFLQKKGYQVFLATNIHSERSKNEIERYGITIEDINCQSKGLGFFSSLKLVIKLRHAINKYQPDFVHAVSLKMVFLSLFSFKISKARYFIGMINGLGFLYLSDRKKVKIIRAVIKYCFKVLCLSKKILLICQNQDDYLFLSKHYINSNRLYLVSGSGVDLDKFIACPEPDDAHITVTVVSRLLLDKGIVEVIEAAKLLQEQGHDFIKIQLVGDVFEANPNSLTREQLNSLLEGSNVTWLGHRSDINEIYQNSHIAVLASYREGLPKSLLEAAACGRALIATDVPGCREVCLPAYNGILVPPKNASALAEQILYLARNKSLRNTYASNSLELVRKKFSTELTNEQVYRIYPALDKKNTVH